MHNLLLAVLLLLPLPAMAAEWGILPFPKNSATWAVQDYVEALDLSRSVNARVQVAVTGWGSLEPEPHVYAMDEHLGGLAYGTRHKGMQPYMGIALINTTRRDLPPDLTGDTEDERWRWNTSEMLGRFEKLLEATRTVLPESVRWLVIGNEVDVYFDSHPAEVDDFLGFYQRASVVARRYYPQAQIGITVTHDGLTKGRTRIIEKMVQASDAAFFTLYPALSFKPEAPKGSIAADLRRLQRVAEGKDIVLQELGYPSTRPDGEARQAAYFAEAIPAIDAIKQITMASIFLLHDLAPKYCSGLVNYYGYARAPSRLNTQLQDFLCTLGLRHEDGTPKAAWHVVAALLAGLPPLPQP